MPVIDQYRYPVFRYPFVSTMNPSGCFKQVIHPDPQASRKKKSDILFQLFFEIVMFAVFNDSLNKVNITISKREKR